MKLKCTNPDCESNCNGQSAMFTADLTVDDNGQIAESVTKIDGSYFECCFCNSNAKWTDEEESEQYSRNDIGAEVYWNDPDDGECSGLRTIQSFKTDEIVILTDESGSITEAHISELE